jgi:hypothetical protein
MKERFNKEKFDAMMSLAGYMQARAITRNQLELRVSLALWALLIAVTYYVQRRPPEAVLILVLLAAVLGHAYFCFSVRIRSRVDIERSFWYFDCAKAMLWAPTEPIPPEPLRIDRLPWHQKLRDLKRDVWSDGIFLGTTILLASISYFSLGRGFIRASSN